MATARKRTDKRIPAKIWKLRSANKLLENRRNWLHRSTESNDNIGAIGELVVSEEDAPRKHRETSVRRSSISGIISIDLRPNKCRAQELLLSGQYPCTWRMTSTSSPTVVVVCSDQLSPGHASSHEHTKVSATEASLLRSGVYGTVFCLACVRTSATN